MTTQPSPAMSTHAFRDEPYWYKDAIIYELHIRAFKDSNGDGIGDLVGLIEQLDYLVDLGVTAVWLLPFYPSPLRDGGYDITDYTGVHEHYGTLADFRRLLDEAHRRGLRIITELVLNHTSAEHPWFQRARRAPHGSSHRDFYVWSDTPKRYADTRVIFQDFETSNWSWDPVANAYYWHRFYAHQPDLNFDNPEVQDALFGVIDFWLDMGVDGMRLDAVPYLFEREGSSCENLPETHAFLKKLRAHVDRKFKDRMLLAEANQWPSDAAAYFGDGDECHMNFHFPLMPRMFMAVELEDSFPIVNILARTPQIPETCQWATFLRNHDELTLEMVTDEDRDEMYRAYAAERHARVNLGIRRRLGPLLRIRRKVELMTALLLSLPGTPVLYYGDEIGMGDNIYLGDRDGVRTPMHWSSDRNAGFSRANPQKLYLPVVLDPEFHYEAINVEAQQANPSSLLWWMKRLIAKRKSHPAFGRGTIRFVTCDNPRVLGFLREHKDERVLVVANLSRFVQCARFRLGELKGSIPVEVFGRTRFPEVGDAPYFVSLGPHGFYWLELAPSKPDAPGDQLPALACRGTWTTILAPARRAELARILVSYARQRRWFRGKARTIKHAEIVDVFQTGEHDAFVLLLVEYDHGRAERYAMPIAFVSDATSSGTLPAHAAIAALTIEDVVGGGTIPITGTLIDGGYGDAFPATALDAMRSAGELVGERGRMRGVAFPRLAEAAGAPPLAARVSTAEQSNTSIVYGERFILKLYRVVSEGPSVELELGRFLSERGHRGTAPLAGALDYRTSTQEPSTLGVLFDYVPNHGDAWQLTLDALDRYFDRLLADPKRPAAPPAITRPLVERAREPVEERVIDLVGPYLDRARLLGITTAELHRVLGSEPSDPLFTPQPFDLLHIQSLYQSATGLLARTTARLRTLLDDLPADTAALAATVVERERDVDHALARITRRKLDVLRIRTHGDLHLGQALWTGSSFLIIDLEGEPARPPSQRRFKRCPLLDVAGMLRSFSYAAATAMRAGRLRPEDAALIGPWGTAWAGWVSEAYLGGYLDALAGSPLVGKPDDVTVLLDFYQLERAIYEVGYELDNRPGWLDVPLRGLLELAEEAA